ncbi:hypothetical protein [Massilia sp. YMA4]|uniref:hypothetical protein n=1 Tax=Massilia sp. YMA4 TaxID=1593482 RepID=UPI001582A601|nr:hypothetical protein [Massilia sp. YMA4]
MIATMMLDFNKLQLSDANVTDLRVTRLTVEIDYLDWQGFSRTLVFKNAISCFFASPHGRALSHGRTQKGGAYVQECCKAAGEDEFDRFNEFSFTEAWEDQEIVKIVAEEVYEKHPPSEPISGAVVI